MADHNFAGTNRHRDVLIGLPRINPVGKPCDLLGEKLNPPIGTSKKRKDMTGVGNGEFKAIAVDHGHQQSGEHGGIDEIVKRLEVLVVERLEDRGWVRSGAHQPDHLGLQAVFHAGSGLTLAADVTKDDQPAVRRLAERVNLPRKRDGDEQVTAAVDARHLVKPRLIAHETGWVLSVPRIYHESGPLTRIRATYADSTTTSVFTELAMKQAWCA